ncbi:PTPLA-domain-containing protein [Massarina eburnea CBS 473.64]|uniref:Very-long-chain (3R)-3-hydroxyacyl-CoA dehydratase n=1 Tax=Massarina eburnea CBS 473.64 TaxID=1395130 RepID=A0A6A6SEH4_9PLEO|nr:PTPLA-domain-containing protein [Massarina eburnea CBS 473.64]
MAPPTEKTITASDLKRQYLLGYNAVCAALWFGVLGRVLMFGTTYGLKSGDVYQESERFTRLSQSLAVLEVLHSAVGIVRAPLFTTAMQVASRLLLVWGIAYNFPQTTKYSPAYSTMLLAWSVTELIRYGYFVFLLGGNGVPKAWTWLRYNTFFVLYPLGVASECWLVYSAIPPASKIDERLGYGLWAVLATYVPGFYTLFMHMLKQRSKVMRAARAEKGGKKQ